MALISRWEVSNYLDSTKGAHWTPDFVGEKADFAGLSAAMVMDNGTGKTSITEGVLWLASLDRKLLDRVKEKIAPASDGCSSHIRIEFVIPKVVQNQDLFVPLGTRVDGEHWVFGVYASRESGNQIERRLYRYQGVLEMVPVHAEQIDEDGNVLKAPLSDEEFTANLPAGALVKRSSEWLDLIDEFWPIQQLRQVVEYQKRGGGDKAASFYDVKTTGVETFDQVFFRQFVAPEVLRGVIDTTDESDRAQSSTFESGIVDQANEVVKAKLATEEKANRLARKARGRTALARIVEDADVYITARTKADETRNKHNQHIRAARSVISLGLPGMPRLLLDGDASLPKETREILLHTGFSPGQILMIQHKLLEGFSYAGHAGIMPVTPRAVLPCAVDPFRAEKRVQYYEYDALLELCSSGSLPPLQRDQLRTHIQKIRSTVLGHAPSALTTIYNLAEERVNATSRGIMDSETKQTEAQKLLTELLDQAKSYEINAQAYNKLAASGHFSAEALRTPLALRDALRRAKNEAYQRLQEHHTKTAQLTELERIYQLVVHEFSHEDLDEALAQLNAALETAREQASLSEDSYHSVKGKAETFARQKDGLTAELKPLEDELSRLTGLSRALDDLEAEFGADVEPAAKAKAILDEIKAANDALEYIKKEVTRLHSEISKLGQAIAGLKSTKQSHEKQVDELEQLEGKFAQFSSLFPTRTAPSFWQDLDREIATHKAAEEKAQDAKTKAEPHLWALRGFRARFGTIAPGLWIEQASTRRAALIPQKGDLERRIQDHEARLLALTKDPVAPSAFERRAHAQLEGLDWSPLHVELEALTTTPERRRALLSHFSAVLFAPVFADSAAAAIAAERLFAGEFSIPVFLQTDLQAWSTGGTLPILEENALYHGLLAGISTRAVEAILDPTLVERERETTRLAIKADGEALQQVVNELAALDPEGPDLRAARSAQVALDQDLEHAVEEYQNQIDAAQEAVRQLRDLQTDANRRLAETAAQYLARGGDEELARARNRVASARAELAAEEDRLHEKEEAHAEALLEQETAQIRRDKAIGQQHWVKIAENAARFILDGGRDKLQASRQEQVKRIAALDTLEQQIRETAAELADSTSALKRATESATSAGIKQATWSDKLETASTYVKSGGKAYLETAGARGENLQSVVHLAEQKLEFDFEAANKHVLSENIGDGGLELQIAQTQEKLKELDATIQRMKAELPEQNAERNRIKQLSISFEHAAFDLYQAGAPAYHKLLNATEQGDEPYFIERYPTAFNGPGTVEHLRNLIPVYQEMTSEIDAFQLSTAEVSIQSADEKARSARTRYERTVEDQSRRGETFFEDGLLQQVRGLLQSPEQYLALLKIVDDGIAHETETHERAKVEEARSRAQLVELLRGLAISAGENLRIMTRVMAPPRKNNHAVGAGFDIEAEIAPETEIDRVLAEIIEQVEYHRKRFDEDRQRGEGPSERDFRETLSARVRKEIYERMFPGARIKVVHPLMRAGRPFYFIKEGISGGQATALMLLWTIKLASYWIERAAARKRGSARRKLRDASHSIIIVDGLFSDLSDPPLIRQSMDAMKKIRGGFQLIGLIHSPYYRNDWELFPTCLSGRKISTVGEDGVAGKMVTIQATKDDRAGRINVSGLRARNTLPSNEEYEDSEE